MSLYSTSIRRIKYEVPVNSPADMLIYVSVQAPDVGGSHTIHLTIPEAERFNLDPDKWACDFLGINNVNDYREWCAYRGEAMCGANTKLGNPCGHTGVLPEGLRAICGGLPFALWHKLHRNILCGIHAKKGE
jgi:hypothetical protein